MSSGKADSIDSDLKYNLFKQWADYLVNNTLTPTNEFVFHGLSFEGYQFMAYIHRFTADELPAANQTNLAIKGIIGIRAMSVISQYTGNSADESHYQVC